MQQACTPSSAPVLRQRVQSSTGSKCYKQLKRFERAIAVVDVYKHAPSAVRCRSQGHEAFKGPARFRILSDIDFRRTQSIYHAHAFMYWSTCKRR
jgi:hypothetical protein